VNVRLRVEDLMATTGARFVEAARRGDEQGAAHPH
jgi:hypothetical protein